MIKTFEDYRVLAARTLNNDLDPDLQLAIYGLGLAGESGEVIELIKKQFGHGHAIDTQKLKLELGDVLWYVAAIAPRIGKSSGVEEICGFDLTQGKDHKELTENAILIALRLSESVGCISESLADYEVIKGVEGRNLSHDRIKRDYEIGGVLDFVLRHLNAIAHCYGMTLAEIAEANIAKLKARYPDGFECDRSINRTV